MNESGLIFPTDFDYVDLYTNKQEEAAKGLRRKFWLSCKLTRYIVSKFVVMYVADVPNGKAFCFDCKYHGWIYNVFFKQATQWF